MNTCPYCDQPADPRWKTHCDFHWALGTFFQYECSHLWRGLRGREDFEKAFLQTFKIWLDGLEEDTKQAIYREYWLGEEQERSDRT